jgi:hypothetical protein
MLIEGFRDGLNHKIGHVGIDLASQFDEASAEVPFFGFQAKIERVDGDTVPAEPWARIERMKSERLVEAAPMTSQISRPIRNDNILSSLN